MTQRIGFACLLLVLGCPQSDPPATASDTPPPAEDVQDVSTATSDVADVAAPGLVCGAAAPVDLGGALAIRITTPTGTGTVYASGAVAVGGVAVGLGTLEWRLGEASGEVTPTGVPPVVSWQTDAIPLAPGDNWVEVSLSNGATVVRDRVLVISSAAPLAGSRLEVSPDTVFAGESHVVRATLSLPSLSPSAVSLLPVDRTGAPRPGAAIPMADDGSGCGFDDKCDEIAGDRIHSACVALNPALTDGELCFRAELTLPAGAVRTGIRCVEVTRRLTPALCEQAQAAVESGTLSGFDALGPLTIAETEFGLAARSAHGPQLIVPNGIPEGARGTPVGARRAALLGTSPGVSDLQAAESHLRPDRCPPITGAKVARPSSPAAFRDLAGDGVIALAGHGGPTTLPSANGLRSSAGSEVLSTGAFDCATLLETKTPCGPDTPCPAGSTCVVLPGASECINETQADLATGRLAFIPGGLALTDEFVDHHLGGKLPGTLVWLGSCRSVATGALALAFLGAGASAVVGFQGFVSDEHLGELAERLFAPLGVGDGTVGEALCHAADPVFGGSPVLLGSPVTSLEVEWLVGPDFENELFGWDRAGDARSVTSFCGQAALEGKRMALLSTGIGHGSKAGELSQTFCIPQGVTTLRFRWRYFSAELDGFCGAGAGTLQDEFDVRFERGSEQIPVKRCDVDDMCFYDTGGCLPKPCAPPSTGCGCGDCYEPYAPVPNCDLCGQAVQATGVIEETFNASALAGGAPVTLRVRLRDSGDGVNDTVFLLDHITLE